MTLGTTEAGVLRVDVPEDPAVRAGYTGRGEGNVSLAVGSGQRLEARARLAGLVGLPPTRAVFMEQVHGGAVAVVGEDDAGRGLEDHAAAVPGVDALVTAAAGLALVVMVADCVPLLLALPGHGVAAVHAGRRGLERDVPGAALDTLCALGPAGSGPAEVVAAIGPAIGGCCYEVPADMAAAVTAAHPAAAARTTWGTPALDLPAALRARLVARGVGRIAMLGSCTRCDAERWFSHRAAGQGSAPGRQGGVIARVEPPGPAGSPSLH